AGLILVAAKNFPAGPQLRRRYRRRPCRTPGYWPDPGRPGHLPRVALTRRRPRLHTFSKPAPFGDRRRRRFGAADASVRCAAEVANSPPEAADRDASWGVLAGRSGGRYWD